MRKAFDANIPKLKPRLRSAAEPLEASVKASDLEPLPASTGTEAASEERLPTADLGPRACPPATGTETDADTGTETEMDTETETEAVPGTSALTPSALDADSALPGPRPGPETPPPTSAATALPSDVFFQSSIPEVRVPRPEAAASLPDADVQARRERLEQVKRKVVAAMRPAPAMPELPETPARAGESALALVRDLEAQLTRAREIETALRADLEGAQAELAQAASDGRRVAERLRAVEGQVEEKRSVLQEMLGEMRALEEERDSAVARAQALATLDEERQTLLDGLSARAEQAEKARAEGEAEIGRLGAELDGRATEAARLRAALAQVTRERDDLARELAQAKRDRDELAQARKALEQVHEALATARAKLG